MGSLLLNTNTYLLIWKSFSFRQHLSILLEVCHVKMAINCHLEIDHLVSDYSWECCMNPVVVEGLVMRNREPGKKPAGRDIIWLKKT